MRNKDQPEDQLTKPQQQQKQQHGVCPLIVNQTKNTVVVFQERGVLYNKQVLEPGEAVGISRLATAGVLLPYKVHAVIGDERALPTRKQSARNLINTAAIPTAFCVGAIAAAVSAGTLTGPSAALAPLVSGMVVKGVVIDAAAIAAGTVMAGRAAVVAEMLVKKHPDKFMCKSQNYRPGKRYLAIRGGIESSLEVVEMKEKEFNQQRALLPVIKEPMDTLKDKLEYYMPGGKKKEDGIGRGDMMKAAP